MYTFLSQVFFGGNERAEFLADDGYDEILGQLIILDMCEQEGVTFSSLPFSKSNRMTT